MTAVDASVDFLITVEASRSSKFHENFSYIFEIAAVGRPYQDKLTKNLGYRSQWQIQYFPDGRQPFKMNHKSFK